MGTAEDIAENLRVEMARKRMSQRKLADQLGWNQQSVSDRIRGRTDWRMKELEQIAAILGVTVQTLIG